MDHIFIHCPFASKVWNLFLGDIGLSWVIPQGMDFLLLPCDIVKTSRKAKILWSLVCFAVCWAIWLERVFEESSKPAYVIYSYAKELACFWGLRCRHLGVYSMVNTKEG